MEEAEPFIAWFTEEILPTIRKTGGAYMTDQKEEDLLADPDQVIGLAMRSNLSSLTERLLE